jgi:hypothetical protein
VNRRREARRIASVIASLLVLGLWVALAVMRPPGPDLQEYAAYAAQALVHPLTAWPREYPPPALGVFLLPRLLPLPYPTAFTLLAALAYGGLLLLRPGPAPASFDWRFRLLTYTLYGASFVVLRRYDVFAVLPATAAVLAAREGHWRRAWILSLVGAWLKVYPVVFWPVFLAAEWAESRRLRLDRLVGAGCALAAPTVFAALYAGPAGWSWLAYLADRPPNLGSFAGDLAAVVTGDWHYRFAYGSLVVTVPLAGLVAMGMAVGGAILLTMLVRRVARGELGVERAVLAAVLTLVLASKVFSVQYVLWVIPLFALVGSDPVWLLAALLVTWEYPLSYLVALGPEILRLRALWALGANLGFLWSLRRSLATGSSTPVEAAARR